MISIENKNYAIRSILGATLDCELYSVLVTLDEAYVFREVKALFPELIFVDEQDETFEEIGQVRISGRLNLPCDPDYMFVLRQYYSSEKDVYFLALN